MIRQFCGDFFADGQTTRGLFAGFSRVAAAEENFGGLIEAVGQPALGRQVGHHAFWAILGSGLVEIGLVLADELFAELQGRFALFRRGGAIAALDEDVAR